MDDAPEPKDSGPLVCHVTADDCGERLDVFLARQPAIGSRPLAKTLVQDGHVRVDDRPAKPGNSLQEGQTVTVRLPPPELPLTVGGGPEAGAGPQLEILHEDPYLLVIDKQPGISVHPSQGKSLYEVPTISSLAAECYEGLSTMMGEDRPGIVHRLDRDTSGVMVLAKTDEAALSIKEQFRARTVFKEYRALSFGEARFDSDHIVRNIGTDPAHGDRMTVVKEGGRDAHTFYEVVERFSGFTWFRCEPKTGRTHQIRVHLSSIGHSVIGDRLYRSRKYQHAVMPEGAPDPGRHCLHACAIRFMHPQTKEPVRFEAPLPEDIESLVMWLREDSLRRR
jgi:23S rRNA pseudouridine1911/1915/1917 synthase